VGGRGELYPGYWSRLKASSRIGWAFLDPT